MVFYLNSPVSAHLDQWERALIAQRDPYHKPHNSDLLLEVLQRRRLTTKHYAI